MHFIVTRGSEKRIYFLLLLFDDSVFANNVAPKITVRKPILTNTNNELHPNNYYEENLKISHRIQKKYGIL